MKRKQLMIGLLIGSILLNGCTFIRNDSRLNENNIKGLDFLAEKVGEFQNEDGGYFYYSTLTDNLYCTYYSLDTLKKINQPFDVQKDSIKKWLKGLDTEFLLYEQDLKESLKNIYYYLEIADMVDYKIPQNEEKKIIETLNMLTKKDGTFYLSLRHQAESKEQFEPSRIFANSLGIKSCLLIGMDIPNREALLRWNDGLINKKGKSPIDKIMNFNIGYENLTYMKEPVEKYLDDAEMLYKAAELNPSKMHFLELVELYDINRILIENNRISKWGIKYCSELEKYINKDGIICETQDTKQNPQIIFTNICAEIFNKFDHVAFTDNTAESINKTRLSNASYSNSGSNISDIYDTYYAYKVLTLTAQDHLYEREMRNYLIEKSKKIDSLSNYEKLLVLDLKSELRINRSEDKNILKEIVNNSSKFGVEKNILIFIKLLDVAQKYEIEISESDKRKYIQFIESNDNEKIKEKESLMVLKVYKYSIGKAIEYKELNKLENQIIEEYKSNNWSEAIVSVLIESGIKIQNIDAALEKDLNNKIEYSKANNSLLKIKGGTENFESTYYTLVLIKNYKLKGDNTND